MAVMGTPRLRERGSDAAADSFCLRWRSYPRWTRKKGAPGAPNRRVAGAIEEAMKSKFKSIGLGLTVGTGLAIILGAAAGSTAVWLSAGIAFGVLFMAAAQRVSKSV